ncbi:MAG TPA: hypothetical protein PKE45_07130 [Caldilineaceae bacterium]|nr:hypothetical protein [Caldilineaceae bacterium]
MPKPKQQADVQQPPGVEVDATTEAASPPEGGKARTAAAQQPRGATPAATPEESAGAALPVAPPSLSQEQMQRLRRKLKAKFH